MAAAFGARTVEKWNKENVASASLIVISSGWILKDSKQINVKFTAEVYCLSDSQVTRIGITQLHESSEEAGCGLFSFFFLYIYICMCQSSSFTVGKITSTERKCRVTDLVSSLHWTRWLLCVWQKHRNVSNYQFLHFLCWTTGPFFFFLKGL